MKKVIIEFEGNDSEALVLDILWLADCAMSAISDNFKEDSNRFREMAALRKTIINQVRSQYPDSAIFRTFDIV